MSASEKVKQAVRAWIMTLVEVIGAEKAIAYVQAILEELSE